MPPPLLPRTYTAINKNIQPFFTIYPLNIEGVTAFKTRFRVGQFYPASVFNGLEVPSSPLRPEYLKRWETRTDPLWWSCTGIRAQMPNRTVRSWTTRKVRQAFVESLRKEGYNSDGTRMVGAAEGKSLFGSAQFSPEPPCRKTSHEELVTQMDKVVVEIIRLQGHKGGNAQFKGKSMAYKQKKGQQNGQLPMGVTVRYKKI